MRTMSNSSPPLLPLFRSDGQARLLTELYLRPSSQRTLSELGRALGVSHATISREADRLEAAGLIVGERVGNQRILRPNPQSRYYAALQELLLLAFGPLPLLEHALRGQPGVDLAFIYGSWAARYAGEPGRPPNDIDLLLVGTPDRRLLRTLSREINDRLGLELNPTVVPLDAWNGKANAFLRSLRSRPLVELHGVGNGAG